MKKRTVVTSAVLAAVLAVSPAALAGCGGDHYSEINFSSQDTSYVVTSQGGSAVSYGNYVYYINGTRGYDDPDGDSNIWDEVVKGALYRSELLYDPTDDNKGKYQDRNYCIDPENLDSHDHKKSCPYSFRSYVDSNDMGFAYKETTDWFGEPLNQVKATKIAPKTIGTSGYSDGGIFIFDNNVYFATPNNEKNSAGNVQTKRTDFLMMPLNGGEPTKVYTSSEGVDTSSSAYAFYKYGSSVYLVVNENKKIVSVKINPGKAEADDPVTLTTNADSVYFPVRDYYYKGIESREIGPEDYVYFVRQVGEDDTQHAGTVIEAMRPNGDENFVVSMTGKTESVEAVRDGVLFYRTTNRVGNSVIAFTNLHNQLLKVSKKYRDIQAALPENERNSQIGNVDSEGGNAFPTEITDMTATYAFRPDKKSNTVYFVGVSSSETALYSNSLAANDLYVRLCTENGTPLFIQNNYFYFSSSNNYYRVPLFRNMEGFGTAELLAENFTAATFGCDYAAGYFVYFGEADQWTTGYTMVKSVDGIKGLDPQFVGKRRSSDKPSDEEIGERTK